MPWFGMPLPATAGCLEYLHGAWSSVVTESCHVHDIVTLLTSQIGKKYQLENEEDLKDKIDFMQVLKPAPFLGKNIPSHAL